MAQDPRGRGTWMGRMSDDVRTALAAPDFWPMFWIFAAMMAAFVLFFWLALGYDMLAGIAGRWRGACRKLGDWESFILFVSPFGIAMASLLAAGELLSALEKRHRWGRPVKWARIAATSALALFLLMGAVVLMSVWC